MTVLEDWPPESAEYTVLLSELTLYTATNGLQLACVLSLLVASASLRTRGCAIKSTCVWESPGRRTVHAPRIRGLCTEAVANTHVVRPPLAAMSRCPLLSFTSRSSAPIICAELPACRRRAPTRAATQCSLVSQRRDGVAGAEW